MNKVVILTDSTCDLDLNIIQEKNINVIPLYVCFGDKNYKDGVDINTEKLYEMVEELGYLPKTSAVSPNEFINFFAPFIDKGYDIVYLGIGSTLSSTFNNAYIASLSFPENRIFLIDSLNLSTGTGLLVLKACKYRDQNFSAAEIQKKGLPATIWRQKKYPSLQFLQTILYKNSIKTFIFEKIAPMMQHSY